MLYVSDIEVSIVGLGRSGTTLVKQIIILLFKNCNYSHWRDERGPKKPLEFWVLCRRDFRAILASSFRGSIKYAMSKNEKLEKFTDSENNRRPNNYRLIYDKYFVPTTQIINMGGRMLINGFKRWEEEGGIDYIFNYEEFMSDKEKSIINLLTALNFKLKEIDKSNLIKINKKTIDKCIKCTDEWLKKHPTHATNSGINKWDDIFSDMQIKIIEREFGYWLKRFNYL